MSGAPLVDASGRPLSSKSAAPAELVRPQASPFPQLVGVALTRIRPARDALPEAWRVTLAFRVGMSDQGVGLALNLTKGHRGRDLARGLREFAAGLDALVDQVAQAQASHDAGAAVQPAPEQPTTGPEPKA
jgi:hypothetical protein